jgi:L-ornithine N5-monooxygenase
VTARDGRTGEVVSRVARHVVIAVGGKGYIPREFPQDHKKVIHSSQYSMRVASALPNPEARYNIAVVGNGQSAAEIFNDLPARYPNANVTIIIKGSALRPSDDSPFVNEVFNPDRVDGIFRQGADERGKGIKADRATNYGVVRLDMLEHLYEQLYFQRMKNPNEEEWRIRVRANRQVVESREDKNGKLVLKLGKLADDGSEEKGGEELVVDAVFVATGYMRNAHEDMLKKTRGLLPAAFQSEGTKIPIRRDYRIDFDGKRVAENAGVWLQGCNESTHGVSFLLNSVLELD